MLKRASGISGAGSHSPTLVCLGMAQLRLSMKQHQEGEPGDIVKLCNNRGRGNLLGFGRLGVEVLVVTNK